MSVWRERRAGTPLIVGHRGGRGLTAAGDAWPAENTLEAFAHAAREGARAIELDARTTADGEVVVFHDADLARMTKGADDRVLAATRSAALREVRLAPGGEPIPTLRETLAWAESRGVAVNVEMKHDVADRLEHARRTAACLRGSRADVLLSSFDPLLLAMMTALSPSVPRALLTHHGERHGWALQRASRPPLTFALHVERTEASPHNVASWRARGLRVGVWTVNDAAEARDLARIGVDFLITDRAGAILAATRGALA